jgi:hypothetical protein
MPLRTASIGFVAALAAHLLREVPNAAATAAA